MTVEGYRKDLNKSLRLVAQKLDLDETRYLNAKEKYRAIGAWLNADNSSLAKYTPEVYPQGSFLLGTVVKPLSRDEYDVDLVCLLLNISRTTSSQIVKGIVGNRLKENERYSKIIEPMNRCWRINYAGEFHMDIIPAIPDHDIGEEAILVPDRDLADWTPSNPKGYAAWFITKMRVEYDLVRTFLARKHKKDVEEIPDYLVKTELQQAVQLMKRHRDIVFQGENDKSKPISIIITTLAGHVYEAHGYQEDLFMTLRLIAENMPFQVNQSIPRVPNPTNNDEDFADKWVDHPEREDAFYDWVAKLQNDLDELGNCTSHSESEEKLKEMFGENIVAKSLSDIVPTFSFTGKVKDRFDVQHRLDPASKWRMAIFPRNGVNVRGYIQHSETRSEEFESNCSPLDKHMSIYFLANTTNIDRPYEVHWQVVNTGEEAKQAGQLRGDFYSSVSTGSHKRVERTLYRGMHWIEAFIIKNGYCIARSGEFVVKIK